MLTNILQNVFQKILQEMNVSVIILYYDNASSYKGKLTIDFHEQKRIKAIKHLHYSHDLVICYFWIFFNLKETYVGGVLVSKMNLMWL